MISRFQCDAAIGIVTLIPRRTEAVRMASTGSSGEERFLSDEHGQRVVLGFEKLWQCGQMCDTVLLAEGKPFQVHRSYLAACSLYFHAMFTEDFQESKQHEVELKGVTAAGLHTLLQYAYTGQVVITPSNLQNTLEAAAHLQFTDVLEFCSQYIRERLTIDNCLEFLNMAEMFELSTAQGDIKKFILENFVDVAQNENFHEITLDLLCELLKDDRLKADSELDVFKVVLQWLEFSGVERMPYAKKVLELIRYGLMSAEEMATVYSNHVMMTEHCQSVLHAALNYHMRLFAQPIIDIPMAKMRAYTDSLVIFGAGKTNNALCRNILATRLDTEKLQSIQTLSTIKNPRYFSAIAVLNNFLFVIGGQVAMAGDGTHATNTAFRYNTRDGIWLQISSMTVPRTYFALVPVEDGLVAVAGKHNRMALSSVEKYKFQANDWTQVASLPNTLFSHAGCSYKNKVYVCGGCPGENFTNQVHCYNSERDGWQRCTPMIHPRGYHVMQAFQDKIIVCAGNNNAGSRADVLDVEAYDVETGQWSLLSPASHGQSEAPAILWQNRLFILGGYSWNQHSFQDIIQSYNLEEDKWEVMDLRLPEPMTGVMACHIQLPQRLYEQHNSQSNRE